MFYAVAERRCATPGRERTSSGTAIAIRLEASGVTDPAAAFWEASG